MTRWTKKLIGAAGIILSSAPLLGLTVSPNSQHPSYPNFQASTFQQQTTEDRARFMLASSVGSGVRNYLQSEANPDKRIVYEQDKSEGKTKDSDKQAVYRTLQDTCKRWTNWYNKDRSANSAVQMNVACHEAADYGRKELNLNTQAKRVNLKSLKEQSSSSGRGAVLLENEASKDSTRCQNLHNRLEQIQSRLRAGYKVREGERLKKRRREIREEIQQRCR